MRRYVRTWMILGLGGLLLHSATGAADHRKPQCPPGHTLVEETVFKEVVRHACKYVTETKKVRRAVYDCKEEPFCLPKCCHSCSLFGHKPNCGECGKCEPPLMRKVLIKREIVEDVPVCRCVVESFVEKVPVKVYRVVPCAPAATLAIPAVSATAPAALVTPPGFLPSAPPK